jgi:hypothetical protein
MGIFTRTENETATRLQRQSRVRGGPQMDNPADWFLFRRQGTHDFYRYIRDHIPLVSASVWAWVRLCFTAQKLVLTGSAREENKARDVLDALGRRVYEGISRQDGVKSLLETFFLEIFTAGQFAGEVILLPDGSGIDYFHTLDPNTIQWEKRGRWKPYIEQDGRRINLDHERFFYYGMGADTRNPRGVSPIASIPFVTEIEEKMLEDMALSSHNAGLPRLHVKVSPPEPMSGENQRQYGERMNQYFDDTVDKFCELDADDNVFTWGDVEIATVGGQSGNNYRWRVMREHVLEDVITGMRLFPWVVGRSHSATKNWVQTQFNLLLQEVDSIQEEARALADWIRNLELSLRGIRARAHHSFAPNQDPFMLEKRQAEQIQFETVRAKVDAGYITKETGAKELGYPGISKREPARPREMSP